MQHKHLIEGGGPSHIGLHVVFEAPDLSRKEAIKRHLAVGNPLLDTDGDKLIAVDEVYPVHYEEEAEQFELVWACDFCGHYSRFEKVTLDHELTCEMRNI